MQHHFGSVNTQDSQIVRLEPDSQHAGWVLSQFRILVYAVASTPITVMWDRSLHKPSHLSYAYRLCLLLALLAKSRHSL